MSAQKNGKWKDDLLKSGLPLEHVVTGKLGEQHFQISGEYAYMRLSEEDIYKERSVDLLAFRLVAQEVDDRTQIWSCLNLLVECKYSRPGIKWIFSPHNPNTKIKGKLINVNQDLCVKRIETEPLQRIDCDLQHCVRGTALHDGEDPSKISTGLHQLRYAAPRLTAQQLHGQMNVIEDGYLHINMICSVLVTTAPLYVFKLGLGIEDFHNAQNLEDIANRVDALIVYQEPGPQLLEYSGNIFTDFVRINPKTESYMCSLSEFLDKSKWAPHLTLDLDRLRESIESSSRNILVVNLDAVDAWTSKIWRLILEAGKTLSRYATLEWDQAKKQRVVNRYYKTKPPSQPTGHRRRGRGQRQPS